MAKRGRRGRSKAAKKQVRFDHRLVLVNWMLNLFGVATFEDLAKLLREPELEGFTEDKFTKYYEVLKILDGISISKDDLTTYDQNIVRHWQQITEKRNREGHVLAPQ